MSVEHSILVLGAQDTSLAGIAERARRLGIRAVRAKTPEDAMILAEDRGFRFGVALVHADLPVADLRSALDAVRRRCHSEHMVAIATGPRPPDEDRAKLRRGGIEWALWEPVGDHALRFHLNRALARRSAALLRGEERVPTEWSARVYCQGREKAASVYSMSSGGVFLATRRPTQRGLDVAVELELPDGAVQVAGRVVYTNVPGNLQRSSLPDGMAVRFEEISGEIQSSIEKCLAQSAAQFAV